jgi:hypothetical protein
MTVSPVNLNQALGTSTTGDRHEGEIPAYVDSTAGRDIGG